jgi:GLPGLI family protein
MKSYKIIAILLLMAFSKLASAQNKHFPTQGTIEFEKRVNMYALIKEMIKKYPTETWYTQIFEQYQKTNPQFKSLKSTLTFGKDQTLFTPIEPPVTNTQNNFFGDSPAVEQNNTIHTNTSAMTSTSQKKVFEELYLVKDSTRKINWKITSEIRNIAGYDCRRANALILDSVYVVAFYSDQIPVSGGPESFTGLPGMILGVALPYEHITWFATKVTEGTVTDDKLKAPVKGKAVTNSGLLGILKSALKDWGNGGKDALKGFML